MKPRKNSLEAKILSLLSEFPDDSEFTVIYHELQRDGEGWSTNTSWRARDYATKKEVLEMARGRWEIFKLNYISSARVCDIKDDTSFGNTRRLEVNCVPFIDIEVKEKPIQTGSQWRCVENGETYLLAEINLQTVKLINISTGARWNRKSAVVQSVHNIHPNELLEVFGENWEFKRIK